MLSVFLFQDLQRYQKLHQSSYKIFLFHPPCRFMVTLRACQYFHKYNPLGIFFRVWNKNLKVKYGLQFNHKCSIGKGFYMAHYGNIVINSNVILGQNCNVAQGLTPENTKR